MFFKTNNRICLWLYWQSTFHLKCVRHEKEGREKNWDWVFSSCTRKFVLMSTDTEWIVSSTDIDWCIQWNTKKFEKRAILNVTEKGKDAALTLFSDSASYSYIVDLWFYFPFFRNLKTKKKTTGYFSSKWWVFEISQMKNVRMYQQRNRPIFHEVLHRREWQKYTEYEICEHPYGTTHISIW